MNLTAIKTWLGEKTTILGLGGLAATATGYASGQLNSGQAVMGLAGALCLLILRENLQTLLTSAGGPVTVGRINTDQATVNTTAPDKPAGMP